VLVLLCCVIATLQYTQYPNEGDIPVVASVPPCHIYGDSDSYGPGVRASLYLQFASALIVSVAALIVTEKGLEEDLLYIRLGFNIIGTCTMINTYINTSQGSFAYLEWYLVTLLVFTLPLLAWPPTTSISFMAIVNSYTIVKDYLKWEDGVEPHEKRRDASSSLDDFLAQLSIGVANIIEPYLEDPFGIGVRHLRRSVPDSWFYEKPTQLKPLENHLLIDHNVVVDDLIQLCSRDSSLVVFFLGSISRTPDGMHSKDLYLCHDRYV